MAGYSPMSRVHLMKDDLVKSDRILSSSASESASENNLFQPFVCLKVPSKQPQHS